MPKNSIYLDYIVNNLPHYIFWKDKNSYFIGCNQLFSDAAGFSSPTDIIGKSDYDMPWRDQADDYQRIDQAIMASGIAQIDYEESQTQMDGTIAIMLVSKVPIFAKEKKLLVYLVYIWILLNGN